MLALYLAVLAAAWLIEAADDYPSRHIHGAVAFIRTGERTPVISGTGKLSALGAQQMHTLGQMFRGRYMGDEAFDGLGQDPIEGLRPDILDPKQLSIQTLDRPYLQASAQAFMQGLYPPFSANSTRNGPILDATGILANGTAIDFPMSGYQYAPILAMSEEDPHSIKIAGDQLCPIAAMESYTYQSTQRYLDTKAASRDFYKSLNASLFDGILDERQIDYYNAIPIYDYLSYAFVHDRDVHDTLANDPTFDGVFDQLRYYADETAWYFYGNASASDLRAISGKTLASLVIDQFKAIRASSGNKTNGSSKPLTLLFGEHQPFISLFSLLQLHKRNPNFRSIPPFASTIIFELFSSGSSNFPADPQDLWVNFHFQNGTNYEGLLNSYAIFGNSPSGTDMPYSEFEKMMTSIMTKEPKEWCEQCGSLAPFCDLNNPIVQIGLGGSNDRRHKLSPAVAGVIGAVVTLAVALLLFGLAMLLGGLRLHRVERNRKKSDLGGFKGSAKLASDADLSLPKNGVAPAGIVSFGGDDAKKTHGHERVGSWELRAKEGDLGDESRRQSFEAIEAAMGRPVVPNERV